MSPVGWGGSGVEGSGWGRGGTYVCLEVQMGGVGNGQATIQAETLE